MKYAMSHFSEHVHGASSESTKIHTELDCFFRSNIVTWIDLQATRGDLNGLIRVAKDLTAILERRAQHISPLAQQVQARTVEGWSVSLSRLATKFGKALLAPPTSIYFLIPPLCPTNTVIYKSFGKSPDGLVLLGSNLSDWDDCIATIDLEDRTASARVCGSTLIAVGMECGDVVIFHHRSFEHDRTILTKYPMGLLHFLEPAGYVAGCSSKYLTLWNRKGEVTWETRLRSRCLFLVSTSTELIGVTESGRSLTWDPRSWNFFSSITSLIKSQSWKMIKSDRLPRCPVQSSWLCFYVAKHGSPGTRVSHRTSLPLGLSAKSIHRLGHGRE